MGCPAGGGTTCCARCVRSGMAVAVPEGEPGFSCSRRPAGER